MFSDGNYRPFSSTEQFPPRITIPSSPENISHRKLPSLPALGNISLPSLPAKKEKIATLSLPVKNCFPASNIRPSPVNNTFPRRPFPSGEQNPPNVILKEALRQLPRNRAAAQSGQLRHKRHLSPVRSRDIYETLLDYNTSHQPPPRRTHNGTADHTSPCKHGEFRRIKPRRCI